MAAKAVNNQPQSPSFPILQEQEICRELINTPPPQLCEILGAKIAEAIFIFDCDGVPGYHDVVKEKLGNLKRYAMISLSPSNIGNPIE